MVEEHWDEPCVALHGTTAEIAEAFTCVFILLTSLIGNTLVIIVVYRDRKIPTNVNLLIVNMAASDFLCSVFVIPKALTQIFTSPEAWFVTGIAGEALCKIAYFFQDVTVAVSLLSLLTIAIERYCTIARPIIGANLNQRKRYKVMILLIWLAASLMYSSHLFTFKLSTEEDAIICTQSWEPLLPNSDLVWNIEFLIRTILFAFIPFIIVAVLHTIILFKLRRLPIPEEGSNVGQRRRDRNRRNQKVLRMLLIVVIAFGICWFPFIIYKYVVIYGWNNNKMEPPCSMKFFGKCVLYLAYLHTSVNPVFYFSLSANYRNGLKNLIHACSLCVPAALSKNASKHIETCEVGKVIGMRLRPIDHQ